MKTPTNILDSIREDIVKANSENRRIEKIFVSEKNFYNYLNNEIKSFYGIELEKSTKILQDSYAILYND